MIPPPHPLVPHIQSNVDMLLTLTGIVWFKWIYHRTPKTKFFKQKKFIFLFFQGFASPLSMITNAIDLNRVTHQGEIRSPSWLNAYRLNQQRNEHMEKSRESSFHVCCVSPSPPPSVYITFYLVRCAVVQYWTRQCLFEQGSEFSRQGGSRLVGFLRFVRWFMQIFGL